MAARFDEVTAVTAVGDGTGRYRALLTEDWNAPVVPQGGLVTAVAARAMEAALGAPEQRLRSITTAYAAQVRAEPVEIEVTILRAGRSMSQLTATVRNPGEPAGHTSIAVFGAERPGFEFTDVAPPDVPPPGECPSYRDPPPPEFEDRRVSAMTFWDQVEGRPALGHAPWDDWAPTTSDKAHWARFDVPPMLPDGRLDPFAIVALCDTMPGAVGERMGPFVPGLPVWLPPSADLTVHLLGDTTSEWVLAFNRARHAGDGYASVEMELWDPDGTLLAYATQMMFFVFPDGPPAPDRRRPPGSG